MTINGIKNLPKCAGSVNKEVHSPEARWNLIHSEPTSVIEVESGNPGIIPLNILPVVFKTINWIKKKATTTIPIFL